MAAMCSSNDPAFIVENERAEGKQAVFSLALRQNLVYSSIVKFISKDHS